MIKKLRNTVQWTYVVNDINCEEIAGTFYKKELQKISKKEFRIDKAIRRKVDRLYLKWKGCEDSFSSWINMDII